LVQWLHYDAAIPRQIRFSASEIAMYFDDHNPPHFHVLGREGAAQVRIDALEVMAVSGRLDLREALDWAAANRATLQAKWIELSGEEAWASVN
jgi:Domain of unknown function (DUF4160)